MTGRGKGSTQGRIGDAILRWGGGDNGNDGSVLTVGDRWRVGRWYDNSKSKPSSILSCVHSLFGLTRAAGGSYGGRRLLPEGFSRDSGYARTSFHHDMLERDIYPPPHVPGVWPQPRRSFDEEYALVRDSRRNAEPFHEMDNFGDHVKYHEDNFRDNYRNIERYHDTDSYHDYGYDRHARFGGRDHEGMSSDYEVRRHLSHESRENSRDRDYDYDWHSYDSDHERGKRDGGRRRRESRDREHEKRGLSRERDQSPYRRRERSRSHGRDDRSRSRSPRGLYYDGNNGVWYSYDHQTQQYVPCNEQSNKAAGDMANETSKGSDGTASKKVVISAPATMVKSNEKASLPDAVHAAATAALAAEKKEKEKLKEIKLASKSSLLANKKKMNNVLAMWKQRNHEGQAARVVLDDKESSGVLDDKPSNSYSASVALSAKSKLKSDSVKEAMGSSIYASSSSRGTIHQSISAETVDVDSQVKPRPVSNSLGGTIMGVIRGSGKGIIKSDTTFPVSASEGTAVSSTATASSIETTPALARTHSTAPFKTDASALGSYGSSASGGRGKRRFSEAPVLSNPRDQIQTTYRDRAAERRNLYGSSSATGDDLSDLGLGDPNCDYPYRKDSLSVTGTMPFPPGVGGRSGGDILSNAENYEVITADRAIDESNGLGKDGSGIKEPVQAKAVDDRSGLGSQQRKVDPSLEAQAGDSYRTIIQKKAIARFREMA
ncbi:hypothetical protein B296_00013323 [Ensete ventricosum]|uniref:G-patch domain-containing protein n=1 Tax=Ensete ventricosum TaxID=4639 RepID=A0A427AH52_ENSVE|nr:hypothetical protein B296_00013323 [Ensete ventricosum]